MYCLAVSTSTKFLCVAVIKNNTVIKEYNQIQERAHTQLLVPKIAKVLSSCGLALADFDCLGIDIGPGSFTGLRIGIAAIKGLSLILKKPILGISSLNLLAAGAANETGLICPIIDAKRQNVYSALYISDKKEIKRRSEYLLLTIEELLKRIKTPVIFSGDGVGLYREKIKQMSKVKVSFKEEKLWYPSGLAFANVCLAFYKSKKFQKADEIAPLYLYPNTCTVRKKTVKHK